MSLGGENNQDLCIQSKSVVLIEHIDKLANLYLAEDSLNVVPQRKPLSANMIDKNKVKTNTIKCIVQESLAKAMNMRQNWFEQQNHVKELLITSRSTNLAKKYFNIWRTKTQKKRRPDTALIKKEKIDNFVERLKQRKEKMHRTADVDKTKSLECYRPKPKESEKFQNRIRTQQAIIDHQKTQLNEQKRLIDDLRLGIIQEETAKSLDDSRNQIREIFRRCSGRVRCKITPPEAVEKDVHVIELRCSKPPKVLLQMEKRAEERMLRRQIILERKKLLDDRKRQQAAEAVEKKRAADEEERKRNLDAVKEKHRQEAEAMKLRDLRRTEYLESIRRANKFYSRKMKRRVFNGMKTLIEIREENCFKCELFYDRTVQKRLFLNWRRYTMEKIDGRNNRADEWFKSKMLIKCFKLWRTLLSMQRQSVQVAEDIFDMKLQSKMFIRWRKYYNWEQMIGYKKMECARKHYERKILVQHFYLWKSLPAVLQLEKAKEEKKRKWREKVWEIIPDYKPYGEESIVVI